MKSNQGHPHRHAASPTPTTTMTSRHRHHNHHTSRCRSYCGIQKHNLFIKSIFILFGITVLQTIRMDRKILMLSSSQEEEEKQLSLSSLTLFEKPLIRVENNRSLAASTTIARTTTTTTTKDLKEPKSKTTKTKTNQSTSSSSSLSSFPSVPGRTTSYSDFQSKQATMKYRMIFVHVGKCGGETIRQTLQIVCYMRQKMLIQRQCLDKFLKIPEVATTKLSLSTVGVIHAKAFFPKRNDLLLQQEGGYSNAFLVSIRNPIDRIKSWFDYVNPYNCNSYIERSSSACQTDRLRPKDWGHQFFKQCYSAGLESMALDLAMTTTTTKTAGDEKRNSPTNMSNNNSTIKTTKYGNIPCSQIAWQGLRGDADMKQSTHLHFNYVYYAIKTIHKYPTKDVMVVRLSQMWNDLNVIEQRVLGGNIPIKEENYDLVTHGSQNFTTKSKNLSQEASFLLCCAIQDEIKVYIELLQRAINLNDEYNLVVQQQPANQHDDYPKQLAVNTITRDDTIAELWSKCIPANSVESLERLCQNKLVPYTYTPPTTEEE